MGCHAVTPLARLAVCYTGWRGLRMLPNKADVNVQPPARYSNYSDAIGAIKSIEPACSPDMLRSGFDRQHQYDSRGNHVLSRATSMAALGRRHCHRCAASCRACGLRKLPKTKEPLPLRRGPQRVVGLNRRSARLREYKVRWFLPAASNTRYKGASIAMMSHRDTM